MNAKQLTILILLILVGIHILRVHAASDNTNALTNIRCHPTQQHIDSQVNLEAKVVNEGEVVTDLKCPIKQILLARKNKCEINLSQYRSIAEDIVKKTNVTWLKDGQPFHRITGNPYLKQLEINDKTLTLLKVALSDAGFYTCSIEYQNLTDFESNVFQLVSSISYRYTVNKNNIYDRMPAITHPPANVTVPKGNDATFTCNKVQTTLTQSTFWFKSCSFKNLTCRDEFKEAFKQSNDEDNFKKHMTKFIVERNGYDFFTVRNVSEDDVGYYGCAVINSHGMDIRFAELNVLDFLPSEQHNPPLFAYRGKLQSKLNTTDNQHSWSWLIPVIILIFSISALIILLAYSKSWCTITFAQSKDQKMSQNYGIQKPLIGGDCKDLDLESRQHLPPEICSDVYNIGKSTAGFIAGHFIENNNQFMTQAASCRNFDKEKNPSISSTNSNPDEASFWGKSMSSHGDNSRAFYLHTSNTTATTVPMYDHPPSTNAGHFRAQGGTLQNACISNPTYGWLRPTSDSIDWMFPRRNLERLNIIGEGQFGQVWRYIARQKDGSEVVVAVKTLKDRVGLDGRKFHPISDMSAEIDIMKSVNDHPNVIKLLNYCIDEYEPLLLIMEYAENGKLQTYLRDCRAIRKAVASPDEPTSSLVRSKELIKFSYHIAKGMEYVSSKGIVHRDLASRNILVSKDKVCKVADFGFARRVDDGCPYIRSTANPVPVKWMAPEALANNKFTTKSDVFSLGILMWEIVTLGATPYEDMSSDEVCKTVITGGRLEKPAHCKDEFFDIMAKCWIEEPEKRPSFSELVADLEKLLLSENEYIELDRYPEHAYYNIVT